MLDYRQQSSKYKLCYFCILFVILYILHFQSVSFHEGGKKHKEKVEARFDYFRFTKFKQRFGIKHFFLKAEGNTKEYEK